VPGTAFRAWLLNYWLRKQIKLNHTQEKKSL
jgi:hypothetical protein